MIQEYTIAFIYYAIFIVGALGIIAGLLWLGIWLAEQIFRQLKLYQILLEFTWDRARSKRKNNKQ